MTENVTIKSFSGGIRVKLREEPDFDLILQETKESFADAASFFKDASVALQFQGRRLNEEESAMLLQAIQSVCSLHIICLVCTDEEAGDYYTKLVEAANEEALTKREQNCQFYKGTLRDGEAFESASSVIVLGDVQKGAFIAAKGNIIVLGRLSGSAYAGGDGRRDRFIAALQLDTESLRIAELKYKKDIKSVIAIKKKQLPRLAIIKQDKIMIRELDFTKELPENNLR